MSSSATAPQPGAILVMVGTRKAAFLFWSDPDRRSWQRSQHHLGWSTHSLAYDPRHNSIYAATNSPVYGSLIQRSHDGGRSWEHFNQGLDFDTGSQRRVREVWEVQPGRADYPGEVWAGSREAGLFRSLDGGATWAGVDSLNRHPTAETWQAGGGGLVLHTIVLDPGEHDRLYTCISAGGAYRSDDGGESWKPINHGVRADFLPEPYPSSGQCVHKLALHPEQPHVLFQQNHCGLYRSDDCGESWVDISAGLPSRFGFPIAVHPHDPQTVYVVPLVSDEQRFVPDGQMAVWRSRDAGNSWQRMSSGLPSDAWLTVLRDGLAVDSCAPAGVYAGTTNGQLFYSRDEGEHWELLAGNLPAILSVTVAQVVAP